MYVKSIFIKNLRSFKEASLNFSKKINLLTGHNNSGKSTIIKSLYKLQDINYLLADDIRVNEQRAEINIILDDISKTSNDHYFHTKNYLTNEVDSVEIEIGISKKDNYRKYRYINPNYPKKVIPQNPNDIYVKTDFTGFSNSETEHNFIYPFFSKRKTTRVSSPPSTNHTFSVFDSFQNLPSKVQKTSSQFVTKESYRDICKDILGFEVVPIASENNEYKLGIYSGYNNIIPLESMGEGVANIIGLITILLTEDDRLFLIEELENDIHPGSLKKLLNLIIEKSEKNQFVVSTHSNIVLKYLGAQPDSRIFYTEYDTVGTSGINIPTSIITEIGNNFEERLHVLELLGYDLFDYDLFKGYIIFEESSAEQIIRDFIIPIFFPQSKDKLRTIAAQGVSDLEPKFNDLNRLFMYLHTSHVYKKKGWVIADGDTAGIDAIVKLNANYKDWHKSHFLNFKKSNFEFYYPEIFQRDVDRIFKLVKSDEKRIQKVALLKKVVEWLNTNDAKSELETCCAEVINILGKIINAI